MVKSTIVQLANGLHEASIVVYEMPEACSVPVLSGVERAEDEFDQTGFILYDAARLLATFLLAQSPSSPEHSRALELGAGCVGLGGIVLAKNNWKVTLTDVPEMIEALKLTVNRNASNSLVLPLMWGDEAAAREIGPAFDLVIASDVV